MSEPQEAETFEATGSGAEKTYPIRAGEVKKGMTVLLKGKPCKVIEVTTSKTGKHGHAKANITGTDIFTGKKVQDICPSSHNMMAPFVFTQQLLVTDVEDGFCFLMDDNGETREDMELPTVDSPDPTLGASIQKALDEDKEIYVIITKAMDDEKITAYKLGNDTE
jgi:translation initiation factor 5A